MKPVETAIVRIFSSDDSIVGLGFLITENRIMTCAHVVADAVGIERDDPNLPSQTISVDFPLVDDNKKCTASVIVWLPSQDGMDDIAVLELNETAPTSTTPAHLVSVDKLWGVEFGAYGFPQYNPKGVWASGKVRGKIEGNRIQIEDIEGTSYFIEPGFSGSPVYCDDPAINGVIGMVVSAETDVSIKAGFMIPSEVLLKKKDSQILPSGIDNPSAKSVPIDMTNNSPYPMPHIWKRKMQSRVVYIGKFEEMQPVYQSKRVFVAHHFFGGDTHEMQDYRVFLKDGLEQIGYLPLFARDDSGTLLETICQDIINTEAGIYDVSDYNANVLIELGMSIGLNQPTIVIAQDDGKALIDPLQQLNPLRYENRYKLVKLIGQVVQKRIQNYHQSGMIPRFCAACGLDCVARKPRQSSEDEYLLVGADPDKDDAIFYHLRKAVKNFNLNWQEFEGDFNLTMCRWVEELRRSKIVFFHSKENDTRHSSIDNATTMIRTGIAIGLGVAWRMILKQGDRMPTDLEGYKYIPWQSSATAFDATLGSAVRTLLSETRPYSGTYDPLLPVTEKHSEAGAEIVLCVVFEEMGNVLEQALDSLRSKGFFLWNDLVIPQESEVKAQDGIIAGIEKSDAILVVVTNTDTIDNLMWVIKKSLRLKKPVVFVKINENADPILEKSNLKQFHSVDLAKSQNFDNEIETLSRWLSRPYQLKYSQQLLKYMFLHEHIVLISSNDDANYVKQLSNMLMNKGLDIWPDTEDIELGIQYCRFILIVASKGLRESKDLQQIVEFSDFYKKGYHTLIVDDDDYSDLSNILEVGTDRLPTEALIDELVRKSQLEPDISDEDSEKIDNLQSANAPRIFISYSRNDNSEYAERLRKQLSERGFSPWLDTESIPSGSNWQQAIEKAIQESDTMITILSPSSNRDLPRLTDPTTKKDDIYRLSTNQQRKSHINPKLNQQQGKNFNRSKRKGKNNRRK